MFPMNSMASSGYSRSFIVASNLGWLIESNAF